VKGAFVLYEPELDTLELKSEPVRINPSRKLILKMRDLDFRWIALGVLLLLISLVCIIQYLKLGRTIDRRLAEGPFSASAEILTAPRTLSAGEPLAANDVVQSLQLSGYSRSRGNPAGWFDEQPGAIRIFPGANSVEGGTPVRLEFANGRISAIVSLADQKAREVYPLDPQLMANLSQARERRRLVRFADIPPSLVHAVISVEDKHFFHHAGFDLPRMLKSAYIDVKDGRKREGASTLTMQLARSLWLDRTKSWRRKAAEFLITMHLEHKLTKQQIFEDYANEIYLGQRGTFSISGFGEGARVFFGKDLSQIDTAEAALLAGLVQLPTSYNPIQYPERARARRNLVLSLMQRNGYLNETEYREAAASPVRTAPESGGESASGYFIALLNGELHARLGENSGLNRHVYTTLDPDLQQAAEAAVRIGMEDVDRQLRKRRGGEIPPGQPQVALVALDPRTGEIKALIGGRNYGASQLNHVLAMRQPGSVFKPFVYAAAMATAVEGGPQIFTPASMLHDETTTFSFGADAYQPRDFHGDFMGDITVRTALAHSLNVPTVSLAQQVGFEKVVAMARRAGLNDSIKPTPSVALGAYEATPLEIAGAYTMFANQGLRVTPTTIAMVSARDGTVLYRHQTESSPALDPRVTYLMVNMMQEVLRSGTGAAVRSRGFVLPAAGKTGTSRDGWFAGFTSELLCVVWVGFDDNRDLHLEGARSALPIWTAFMKRASQIRPYSTARDFRPPSGVTSVNICTASGDLAGANCPTVRPEVFIAGTEPEIECDLHNHGQAGGETPMIGMLRTLVQPACRSCTPAVSGPQATGPNQ
jgi:penicillin-binding protein 1B